MYSIIEQTRLTRNVVRCVYHGVLVEPESSTFFFIHEWGDHFTKGALLNERKVQQSLLDHFNKTEVSNNIQFCTAHGNFIHRQFCTLLRIQHQRSELFMCEDFEDFLTLTCVQIFYGVFSFRPQLSDVDQSGCVALGLYSS